MRKAVLQSNHYSSVDVSACLCCESQDSLPTGTEAPSLSVISNGNEFIQEKYSVRECAQCGLLYKTKILSQELLAQYYASADYQKWEPDRMFPTEQYLLQLLKSFPSQSSILDFGCGSGRLLASLCERHKCFGIEINDMAAKEAGRKGVNILDASELDRTSASSFDAVIAVDVFDHLIAPFEMMTRLWKLVRPDGWLIIVTGNADSKACRLDPSQFWYFRNVEHLCMLTRESAEFMKHKLAILLLFKQMVGEFLKF